MQRIDPIQRKTSEDKKKLVEQFATIYAKYLKDDSELDALVIARTLKRLLEKLSDNKNLSITHFGRKDLSDIMTIADPNFKYVDEISEMQFIIVTDNISNQRYILDLGSRQGTILLDKNTITNHADFKKAQAIGKRYFEDIEHEIEQESKVDNKEWKRWNGALAQAKIMREHTTPESYDDVIFLNQINDKISWSALPPGNHKIRIHNFTFQLNDNLSIELVSEKKEAKEDKREVKITEKEEKKAASPPVSSDYDKKLISEFNETMKDLKTKIEKSKQDVKGVKNFALEKAIRQIEDFTKAFGGIENLLQKDGCPDSFKCPVSYELMVDPQMDENGHTFDLSTINQMQTAVKKNPKTTLTSPITNNPYSTDNQFTKNKDLDRLIDVYCRAAKINRSDGLTRSLALPSLVEPKVTDPNVEEKANKATMPVPKKPGLFAKHAHSPKNVTFKDRPPSPGKK